MVKRSPSVVRHECHRNTHRSDDFIPRDQLSGRNYSGCKNERQLEKMPELVEGKGKVCAVRPGTLLLQTISRHSLSENLNKCTVRTVKPCLTLVTSNIVFSKFALYLVLSFLALFFIPDCKASPRGIDWSQWWTYDGISGPRFWGVINPAWAMCKDGRRQSPINIDPRTLLYDPNLSPFTVDKVAVEGDLINTGHSVEWHIRTTTSQHTFSSSGGIPSLHSPGMSSKGVSLSDSGRPSSLLDSSVEAVGNYTLLTRSRGSSSRSGGRRKKVERPPQATMTGGPLSYTYTLTHARLHFGEQDEQGSEHLLDNHAFPAELQIYGYNSQLYSNFSQAVGEAYGVAAIAVLVMIGDRTGPEFRVMMEGIKSIRYGGSSTPTPPLVVSSLIPPTEQFMTYEGSITEPACHETVTWIVPNKPIYISLSLMRDLRSLRQGNSEPLTHAPIANNFRPVQTAHHRTVRANINTRRNDVKEEKCHITDPRLVYKAGNWLET